MTPLELCQTYLALKTHFTQKSFNFFNHTKVPLKADSFQKRPDKFRFESWAKHNDPVLLIVSNYIQTGKFPWIGDLDERHYVEWQKKIQSLTYFIKNDLTKLEQPFIINLKVEKNEHPPLVRLTLSGEINFETFCVIVDITQTFDYLDKKLHDDIVWKKLRMVYTKYYPFIKHRIDRKKIVEIFNEVCDI
jgi:hypothetical protein